MTGNTDTTWGWPAKLLHWIGAILILLLLGHGWWMTHLAPRGPVRLEHYAGHAGLGYDLMALLVLRLLWRWTHAVPTLPRGMPRWEQISAHISHYGLYVLMLATTLLGWALAGTVRTPFNKDAFGLPVPLIYVSQDRAMHRLLEDWHKYMAYALLALIVVHVIAALRHHFVKRDDVLWRMWFGSRVNR
jgi:cytochrome b561